MYLPIIGGCQKIMAKVPRIDHQCFFYINCSICQYFWGLVGKGGVRAALFMRTDMHGRFFRFFLRSFIYLKSYLKGISRSSHSSLYEPNLQLVCASFIMRCTSFITYKTYNQISVYQNIVNLFAQIPTKL